MHKTIAVMQDLQGPKIRVGRLAGGAVQLVPGASLVITQDDVLGTQEKISTTYDKFVQDVKPGQYILLADGLMKLHVASVDANAVTTTVIDGGTLTEHKGINLPDTALSVPSLTEKDIDDLAFGVAHGVDYIALSFVRTAGHVHDLRARVKSLGADIPIIAKIEKPEAIANIDAIIRAADAVMVARGDLGVEIPAQNVPMIQKEIIRRCNEHGVPVITATQMLESMVRNPRPTRAEASDVANAVLDGSDAVMLSEETAAGDHPVEAVQMMAEICAQAEHAYSFANGAPAATRAQPDQSLSRAQPDQSLSRAQETLAAGSVHHLPAERAIARSACILADRLQSAAILSLTHSGTTARLLSRERPGARIIAVTASDAVARRVCLYWGVESMMIDPFRDTDSTLDAMRTAALARGLVSTGETVVFTGGHPLSAKAKTNFIKAEKL